MSQVSHSTDRSRARDEMRLTSEASMLALDASKWQVRLVSLRREPREAHVLFLEKKSLSRVERARQASWRASECDAHVCVRPCGASDSERNDFYFDQNFHQNQTHLLEKWAEKSFIEI